MLKFVNITGKKESKLVNDVVVIGAPTSGQFKLTPATADLLQLTDGDSVLTVIHPDDRNRVFIAKGISGVPMLDADGEPMVDKRGRVIFEENTQFGALLSESVKGSGMLQFAAATAWNASGCDVDNNTVFTLGEGEEGEVETGNKNDEGEFETHTTVFYELILKEKKEKSRKSKSDDVSETQEVEFEEGEEEEEV
jgi:hypothetical protein